MFVFPIPNISALFQVFMCFSIGSGNGLVTQDGFFYAKYSAVQKLSPSRQMWPINGTGDP